MFFFFSLSLYSGKRFQVAGSSESRLKGSEEAGGAGAGCAVVSERRDAAATRTGKLALLRLSLSGLSPPPILKFYLSHC